MTSYPVTQRLHQQLRQSASREAPPQDNFLVSDVTKDEEIFFSRVPDVTRSRRPDFFGCRRHQEMIARGPRRHLRSPFPG